MDPAGQIPLGQLVEGVGEVDQGTADPMGDQDHVRHKQNEQDHNSRDQQFRKRKQGLRGLVLTFHVFQEDHVVDQWSEDDSDRHDNDDGHVNEALSQQMELQTLIDEIVAKPSLVFRFHKSVLPFYILPGGKIIFIGDIQLYMTDPCRKAGGAGRGLSVSGGDFNPDTLGWYKLPIGDHECPRWVDTPLDVVACRAEIMSMPGEINLLHLDEFL